MTPIEDPKKERVFQPVTVEKIFEPPVPTLGVGLSGMGRVIADAGVTRDPSVITAESTRAAAGNDMARSGGIYGTMDMKGVNEIMAKENAARQAMIDMQRTDTKPGAGMAVLADPNAEQNAKWERDMNTRAIMGEMERASRIGGRAGKTAADAYSGLIRQQMSNDVAISGQEVTARGQDLNHAAQMAQQGITARGQDLNYQSSQSRDAIAVRGQDISAAESAARLGIQQADSARAGEKWGIEKGILQGQAEDSVAVRKARGDLSAAIESGDPTKIAAAREKAVAAGIKFDKPNNEYTAVTDSMGLNITRTNKDTGAIDIIDGKTGAVKSSIPAPGQKPAAPAAVPPGYTVVGTAGGKRVLQDAQGKRFVEGN